MVTRDQAQEIAYDLLRRSIGTDADPVDVCIIEQLTQEESFGWLFFYNDRRYVESGDIRYALCGNVPVVVLRDTGKALFLPWSSMEESLDSCLRDFAASLKEE